MGVMACDRDNCENIMCSIYSNNHGFICYDCYQELKAQEPFKISVSEFFVTPKNRSEYRKQWEQFLNEEFRNCCIRNDMNTKEEIKNKLKDLSKNIQTCDITSLVSVVDILDDIVNEIEENEE